MTQSLRSCIYNLKIDSIINTTTLKMRKHIFINIHSWPFSNNYLKGDHYSKSQAINVQVCGVHPQWTHPHIISGPKETSRKRGCKELETLL